jgi:hypothetical protein
MPVKEGEIKEGTNERATEVRKHAPRDIQEGGARQAGDNDNDRNLNTIHPDWQDAEKDKGEDQTEREETNQHPLI